MLPFESTQVPAAVVLHDTPPVVPPLQFAVTVTPLTRPSVPLWTVTVMLIVYLGVVLTVVLPSRSPTCRRTGAVVVTVTVAGALHSTPSRTRYVNESTPDQPAAGVYFTDAPSEEGGRGV